MSAVQTLSGASAVKFLFSSCSVPVHELWGGYGVFAPAGGAFPAASDAAPKARLTHQPGYPLAVTAHSKSPELGMDPPVGIDLRAPAVRISLILSMRAAFSLALLEGGRSFQW
jgi:hypothetical protein